MIALNLLPDVKKEYLRSQRLKRLFVTLALLISGASILVVLIFGSVLIGQNKHISDIDDDIAKYSDTLKAEEDLGKILTVQNQLNQLPQLHEGKPAVNRLFGYLKLLVPDDVRLTSTDFDFSGDYTAEVKGFGEDFPAVNKFADTLKNAEFRYSRPASENEEIQIQSLKPFSAVTLSSISPDEDQGAENKANFKIELIFDQTIFDNTLVSYSLKVPNIVSSPSTTERPAPLFDQQPLDEETQP